MTRIRLRKCILPGMLPLFALLTLYCNPPMTETVQTGAEAVSGSERPVASTEIVRVTGILPGQALYEYAVPRQWNRDLIMYAHGYVSPQDSIALPEDAIDGWLISELVLELGYAYATTSYRSNGLIIDGAIQDLLELVDLFIAQHEQPVRIYLIGDSNGGLITALSLERYADIYDGGISICAPLGSFRRQINHYCDVSVLFQSIFNTELQALDLDLGSPGRVPEQTITRWEIVESQIEQILREHPEKLERLFKILRIPTGGSEITDVHIQNIVKLLRYNVMSTNNTREVFGSVPYDNFDRKFRGSGSIFKDWKMNRDIQRFRTPPAVVDRLKRDYKPTGRLTKPFITLHNSDDPVVQYYQQILYRLRIFDRGSSQYHINIPISRYGHCNIQRSEFLAALSILVSHSSKRDLIIPSAILPAKQEQTALYSLAAGHGAAPRVTNPE